MPPARPPRLGMVAHPVLTTLAGLLLLFVASGCSGFATKRPALRLLAWVGYDEPDFIEPLERAVGAQIEVKTYVGGDQMYSLFHDAPPGTYDAVIVDAEYGKRLYEEGALDTLPRSTWFHKDLLTPFQAAGPASVGGSVYAAVLRWGALGLVYNENRLTQSDVDSYSILWNPRMRGHVGIFDWYLPNMAVLSRALGFNPPFDLSKQQLGTLADRLNALRGQVRAIQPSTGEVINDLRTGETWVVPGVGEWASAVLAEEGAPITWTVPREGGVMWIEAVGVPKTATHKELSAALIQHLQDPGNLARLAWRKAYHSQVSRLGAYDSLPNAHRALLKAMNLGTLDSLATSLTTRRLPAGPTNERDWLNAWTAFKAR